MGGAMENCFFNAINKLIKINRAHKLLIDEDVEEIGIHRTQHRILMYLARTGQLPSQKQLAACMDITPAAVTLALQKMESDGFISRKLGTDNRFNEITITEKGREVVEKTKVMFSAVDERLFSGFSQGEIEDFTAYLDRIIENVKGERK